MLGAWSDNQLAVGHRLLGDGQVQGHVKRAGVPQARSPAVEPEDEAHLTLERQCA